MRDSPFEVIRPDTYLERLAESDVGRSYKRVQLDALRLAGGETVLELGCGPGADLAALAEAVGERGRVLGVDVDTHAVEVAAERLAADGRVRVWGGDIRSLDLGDASVDRVRTDRVLQHVPEPLSALREATRVLQADGLAVFAEPDWATLAVDHPDTRLARRYTDYVVDRVVLNSCIGRQLPALVRRAGLALAEVIPFTAVFTDVTSADRMLGFRRVTQGAVREGYLDDAQAGRLLEHLADEPFFASVSSFIVVATKPQQPA